MRWLRPSEVLVFIALAAATPVAAQVLELDTVVTTLATENAGPKVRSQKLSGGLVFPRKAPLPQGWDFPTLSLDVGFDEKSAFLTARGMVVLRSVGLALADPRLADTVFQVGAHVGGLSPTRANDLALARARVVVTHLIRYYGIAPARLIPIAYGADRAGTTGLPDTRIEFINVSDL